MKQFLQTFSIFILQITGMDAQSGPSFPGNRDGAPPTAARMGEAFFACSSACSGALGENIYPNGDFGFGVPNMVLTDPGLAPGYIYQTNPPPNDGFYSIANNTTTWGSFAANAWINVEDNGPEPYGYMMVINASYPPGLFFQNTVAVCENTLYEFSVDVINLIESHLPQLTRPNLSFMIDGVALCETGDIAPDELWHTVRFSFTTAPGQTSVVLAMRNNAPGGGGNDLAIDNISFRACGPHILTPAVVSFCAGPPVLLEAQLQNTPFATPIFQWQELVAGTWTDIPGADSLRLEILSPQDGSMYRLLVASAVPNLSLPNCRVASEIIQLEQRPALLLQTAGTDAHCFGENSAMLGTQALTGIAPYTYAWSNGETSDTLSGLPAGTYWVTATDALGCIGQDSVTVSAPPPMALQIDAPAVPCFGGNDAIATASVSGGVEPYAFLWDNGQTTAQIGGLSAGNYALTITDANGCSAIVSGTVAEPPVLLASASALDVSCFGGNDAQLGASASGGVGPYTFMWNNGQTTALIGGLSAGNYALTITDSNGCSALLSSAVTEPTALLASATALDVSCFGGNDAQLGASTSGGVGPYTYSWNNGQTTAQIGGLSAGNYALTITDANGCSALVSSTITEPPALLASATTVDVSCFGGNDAQLGASASGGVGPYTYSWNNGQTTAQIGGLSAGNYALTITDANGCSAVVSSTVTEPPALLASATALDVSCFGGNDAHLGASASGGVGPYTYLWNNGQTTAQIGGLSAGNYALTLTDAHGCSALVSSAITEPTALLASATTVDVSCFGGNDAQLGASASGGVGPYTYSWNNGQTTAQIGGLSAGNYALTVTDAHGCSAFVSSTIAEPPALLASASTVDVSCFGGNDAQLGASASGGVGPYTYLWNNGQTTAQIGGLSAGNYALTITDTHGCSTLVSSAITEPPALLASATALDVSCFGGNDAQLGASASGGVGPYTYSWNNGQTTAQIGGLSAGNYALTVTDAHGCSALMSSAITEPPALLASATATDVSCWGGNNAQAGASVSGGVGPYTFLWNNGQTTAQINGLTSGWYGVSISDAHQCRVFSQVWVGQPAELIVDPFALPASCPEAPNGLASASAEGGVGPYQFVWSNGLSGPEISGLSLGTYTVTVTDAQGCTALAAETVAAALEPALDLGLDQTVFLGEEILLTAHTNLPQSEILDYQWSGPGAAVQCADCFQYQFLPIENGCVQVLVRSVNGCQALDEVCFNIMPRRRIYVPNVFNPDDNGENDYFTIYSDASVKQIRYLKIFNRWGEQLFQANNIQTNHEASGWGGTYRDEPMNPGVFVWVAELEFIDGEVLFLKGDVTLVR